MFSPARTGRALRRQRDRARVLVTFWLVGIAMTATTHPLWGGWTWVVLGVSVRTIRMWIPRLLATFMLMLLS